MLSTNDTASLNKETASITTAIDNIVANTKYNNIALMGTSDVNLSIGASPNGTNQLTITIGGRFYSIVTSASNATSTSNTLKTSLANNQGQVSGGTAAEKLEKM